MQMMEMRAFPERGLEETGEFGVAVGDVVAGGRANKRAQQREEGKEGNTLVKFRLNAKATACVLFHFSCVVGESTNNCTKREETTCMLAWFDTLRKEYSPSINILALLCAFHVGRSLLGTSKITS